uniref:Uncharacterized protein n=1 Tax=Arundo donax TaxID=35708 RepID=A0A0A9FAD1_ARUDO
MAIQRDMALYDLQRGSTLILPKGKRMVELQGKRLDVDLSLDQGTLFFGNLCKEWSSEEFDVMCGIQYQRRKKGKAATTES